MITYKKVDRTCFPQYDLIPMRVNVKSYYRIEKINRGLGGFNLVETPVEPYVKDFCTGDDESVTRWEKRRDLTHWAFFMAFDGERPVGAAAVASHDKTADMLSGRDDLAVLWDIRVDDAYKQQGVGQALFDMAADWSREQGLVQMKIECQNNNVPAVKFYHKQGAVLSAIDGDVINKLTKGQKSDRITKKATEAEYGMHQSGMSALRKRGRSITWQKCKREATINVPEYRMQTKNISA